MAGAGVARLLFPWWSTSTKFTYADADFFLERRRGVSKNSEKQKNRKDGKKKQLRKAPLSALGVLR